MCEEPLKPLYAKLPCGGPAADNAPPKPTTAFIFIGIGTHHLESPGGVLPTSQAAHWF